MDIRIILMLKNVTDFQIESSDLFEEDHIESIKTLLLKQGIDYEDLLPTFSYDNKRDIPNTPNTPPLFAVIKRHCTYKK